MSKHIVLIRFSSREQGNCAKIAAYLRNYYAAEKVHEFSACSSTIQPCGNCDYECLQPEKACPNRSDAYTEMMDAICSADLAYFIVPNFCGYPCANYFAFNERSVGYFNMDRSQMEKYMAVPKRFIIISNTENQNFENAMQQQTHAAPDILYLKSGKYGKRSIAGNIMDSDDATADLEAFLERP